MKKALLEVLDFLKNPTDERIDERSTRKAVKYIFYFLAFEILCTIFLYLPAVLLVDMIEPLVREDRINYETNTLLLSFVLMILAAPLIEELIFRYPLRYNKVFAALFYRKEWDKAFRYLVYLSILLFGFVHVVNYKNNSLFFFLSVPLIVSTQAFGGVFLAFLRVRFRLLTSLAYHMLWNGLALSIMFLGPLLEKPFERTTDDYVAKIESPSFNMAKGQKFKIDSADNKIYKVEIREYSINHVLDSLFHDQRDQDDYLINVDLKSEKGIRKSDFQTLLLEYDKENSGFW